MTTRGCLGGYALAVSVGAVVAASAGQVLANPLAPVNVRFTRYNIDPDDGFLQGAPDPLFRVEVAGVSRRHEFDYFCQGSIFPPVGCIIPAPPPQEWIPLRPPIDLNRDIPFRVGNTDASKVPVRIEFIESDTTADNLLLTAALNIDLYSDSFSGTFLNNGATLNGRMGEEMCVFAGRNGMCFIITGSGDRDGDGLLDVWEGSNAVPTEAGPLDLSMADPARKDIFLEIDWLAGSQPTRAVLRRVAESFERAPFWAGSVPDPNFLGIRLHVDTGGLTETDASGNSVLVGENLGGGNGLRSPSAQWCGMQDGPDPTAIPFYYQVKASNFAKNREGIYHYAIAKRINNCDACGTGNVNVGGCGEQGGDDMLLDFRHRAAIDAMTGQPLLPFENADAALLMHELGHNLNINHGGAATDSQDCKPPHLSVMNLFYGTGIPRDAAAGRTWIDFSPPLSAGGELRAPIDGRGERVFLSDLVETALDETTPFNTTGLFVFRFMTYVNGAGLLTRSHLFNTLFDWNGDGATNNPTATANIDINPTTGGFPACNTPPNNAIGTVTNHNDWAVIQMRLQQGADLVGGPGQLPVREPTRAEIEAIGGIRPAGDLSVALEGPAVVAVGASVAITARVNNAGAEPAQVTLTVTLPAGITPTSSTAGCTTAGAVITCAGALAAGASQPFTFTLLIGPNTTGQGRAITASVTSDSIADTNPANNQASLPLRLPPALQVPPDVTISTCASPNIGQATASAEDGGPVVISSDAPAVFPVGITVVTWTATDSRGVQATGQQRVTAVLGDDASCCPTGSNVIRGTAGDDVLAGTAGSDCILGLAGADVISGHGGNDVLSGGAGSDVIDGGDGDDTVFGGSGLNSLHGGAGDDLVVGGNDSEVVTGGDGNDRLQGGGGNDNISGGAGNDVVEGGDGADVCSATPGQDVVLTCAP